MNTDFGGHRLLPIGKKDNGSLASAVAHAAKRRQATTAVPLSAPFCGDGHPSFCTYAKFLLAAVIIGISRSARSRSRDEYAYRRAGSSTKHRRYSQEDEVRKLNNSWDFE